MRQLLAAVDRLAPARTAVLLLGETGVGKDWLAQLLHRRSGRPGPLISLGCEGLSKEQLEAPAGATLLLQDIGRLGLSAQGRLAELLDLADPPHGGPPADGLRFDVRFLASSTEDLARSVQRGAFLPGLYYRLAAVELRIPPLKERREDIEGLVAILLSELEQKYDMGPFAVTDALLEALRSAPWPGNVRQLRAVLEGAIVLSTQELLDQSTLPADWGFPRMPDPLEVPIGTSLADVEKRLILETLRAFGGHRLQAAKVLGISRRKLHYRLREYREEGRSV